MPRETGPCRFYTFGPPGQAPCAMGERTFLAHDDEQAKAIVRLALKGRAREEIPLSADDRADLREWGWQLRVSAVILEGEPGETE
jgi:hypothetical protein